VRARDPPLHVRPFDGSGGQISSPAITRRKGHELAPLPSFVQDARNHRLDGQVVCASAWAAGPKTLVAVNYSYVAVATVCVLSPAA